MKTQYITCLMCLLLSYTSLAVVDPATGQSTNADQATAAPTNIPDRVSTTNHEQGASRLSNASREQEADRPLKSADGQESKLKSIHLETPSLPVLLNDNLKQKLLASRLNSERKLIIYNEWLLSSSSLDQANRQRKLLEPFGLKISRRQSLTHLGFVITVFRVPADKDSQALRKKVEAQYPQLRIEFNQRYQLLENELGKNVDLQFDPIKHFAHRMIGAPISGCSNFTGTVAMIDSKVNAELAVFSGKNIESASIVNLKQEAASDHGTAVAYLISQLLPQAKIVAVNVYKELAGKDLSGQMETRTDWLLSGFEAVLALEEIPRALNMSFGGNPSDLLERAINKLADNNIRLIAAAGNGGSKAEPVYPAAYEQVAAVSALDADGRLWKGSNQGDYLRYTAPGADIWAVDALGQWRFVSGTSYAAPWVTVLAALATEEQWLKPALVARDLGKLGRDSEFGYGLMQLSSVCR